MHVINDMDEVHNIDEMDYMIMWKKSFEICLCFFSMLTFHMNIDLCHVIVIQVSIVFYNLILFHI
jgi:hypothetical protein